MSIVTTKESLEIMQEGFKTQSNMLKNGMTRITFPWDKYQLSKVWRRGKTPEEIQDMRRKEWIERQPKNDIDYSYPSQEQVATALLAEKEAEYEDFPGLSYVEVQIDRSAIAEAHSLLKEVTK